MAAKSSVRSDPVSARFQLTLTCAYNMSHSPVLTVFQSLAPTWPRHNVGGRILGTATMQTRRIKTPETSSDEKLFLIRI